MKKFWKAGLLTLTLVVPVLLLGLLHLTADNRYKLPKFFVKTDSTGKAFLNKTDTVYCAMPVIAEVSIAHLFDEDSTVNKNVTRQLRAIQSVFPDVPLLKNNENTVEIKALALAYMQNEAEQTRFKETFSANGKLLLIDKVGVVRGVFNGENEEEINRLSAEIKVLREIQKNEKQ